MYYKVINSYGEAYIKATGKGCVIVGRPFDGPLKIEKHPYPYRRQPEDMVTDSSKREFEQQARQVFSQMI